MSEPLVLVILLGAADPTADRMMTAARASLGRDAVVLADTSASKEDTQAIAIGERVSAWAVVRVSWADDAYRQARLHVHVASTSEWVDEAIAFNPEDTAAEKGRTIGYTIASMVRRTPAEPELTRPPTEQPRARAPETTRHAEPGNTLTPGVDAFASGTGTIGGAATSFGGTAGARLWLLPRFGLRGAVGGRAGSIPEAGATTSTLVVGAGPSYRVPIGSEIELGVRADVLVLRPTVTRSTFVDTTRTRWLGAIDLMIEANVSLGQRLGVVAAAGAELAFGATTVSVGGAPAATLPRARGIIELGLRLRF